MIRCVHNCFAFVLQPSSFDIIVENILVLLYDIVDFLYVGNILLQGTYKILMNIFVNRLSFRFQTRLLTIESTDRLLLLTAVDKSVEIIFEKVVNIIEEVWTVSLIYTWNKQAFCISLLDG
jgi:hypothetical protein